MKLSSSIKLAAVAAASCMWIACGTHVSSTEASRILRSEKFVCHSERVRIVNSGGDVIVKKGETSPRIYTTAKEIIWYCEDDHASNKESWMSVFDTKYIIVSRDSSGNEGKVVFFREP